MATEESTAIASIICATNQSLKTVLRDGGKQAGIASAMLLDKISDVVRELKAQPKSWLLLDYQIPPQDMGKILHAAQASNSFAVRPIYIVAPEFDSKLVDISLEFKVTKLRFGDINGTGIAQDLKDLSVEYLKRAPIADSMSTIHGLIEERKMKEAGETFATLIQSHPTNMSVVTEYIDFLIQTNDMTTARKHLEEAQVLEPNDVRIKHLQARFYMRSKNYDEGIRILESLEKSNPWSPGRLIELGNALLATSRFNESRERFDRALDLDSDNVEAHSGKAQSVLLSGDVQQGLELLRNLGQPRQMAATLNAAAIFAARRERTDEARNLYEQGIQLLKEDGPSCSRLWYNLGILEHKENKIPRALECFTKACGTDPSFKDAKHNLDIVRQLAVGSSKPVNSVAIKSETKTINTPSVGRIKKKI